MTDKSFIDRMVEKHWSALSIFNRRMLLLDLGVGGRDKGVLGGKTTDEIVHGSGDGLPGKIRGRLIMALTDEGFSKEEYIRVSREIDESAGNPSCERSN